jgi:uncharacterized protein YceH (UPF0502 family)
MEDTEGNDQPRITSLSSRQRRIVGVLVEKGFTTPAGYPLTLKAVVTGCNQTSNRQPVVSYSEDDVLDALNELRELGLVAVVHTDSGRSERYRHYLRRRFDFSEPQLAILIELLLRGRQTLGNLRSRASRMVAIDSLDQLRQEVTGLMEQGFVYADGPLERRGIEVDHNLYGESEKRRQQQRSNEPQASAATGTSTAAVVPQAANTTGSEQKPSVLTESVESLKLENVELRRELSELQEQFNQVREDVNRLRYDLGGS